MKILKLSLTYNKLYLFTYKGTAIAVPFFIFTSTNHYTMNWIISILIITILILIYSRQRSKTKREQYLSKLRLDWGKPKETTQYNFDLISSYHLATLNNSVFQNISNTTNQDLDLDDIFTFLDRTSSAIGQQYLYHKLHCIKGQSEVRELDDSIDFFIKMNTRDFKYNYYSLH